MSGGWQYKPRNRRGIHDSSSPFGQRVHDELTNGHDWIDNDRIVFEPARNGSVSSNLSFAKSTGILRHIEQYTRNGSLSAAQKRVLPTYAMLFFRGLQYRDISPGSGIYIVESDHPYRDGLVRELKFYRGAWLLDRGVEMAGDEFATFLASDSPDTRRRAI